MQQNEFKPGDVDIISVMLYSDDGCRQYDLIQQCQHIDIYESILSPIIYAELFIVDSNDLLREFALIAEERVEMEFKTPGSPSSNFYSLRVKSINNTTVDAQQKSKSYTLILVSPELIADAKTKVDRKFESEISSSIKIILKDYIKTTKAMEIEPTKGIDNVLLSKMGPFMSIDKLRRRAVSKKYISSSFVFFENKRGYNFTTLERLFDMNKDCVCDKVFFVDSNVKENVETINFRNIIGYRQITFADSIDKIMFGGLNNTVGSIDFTTGDLGIHNYQNTRYQDKFKLIDDNTIGQNTSLFEKTHGQTTKINMLVPYDSARNESFLPEKLSILQAFTQKITQNLVHIHIYGDNEITAGDVIGCNFPEGVGTTKENVGVDRLSSGNFLVSKLRHIISFGAKPTYTQSAELIKGGMLES